MSLFATALRFSVAEALRRETAAGALVFESGGTVPPSDDDTARMVIVVETGALTGAAIDLLMTMSVMTRTIAEIGGEARPHWAVGHGDMATDRVLDLLATQVVRAVRLGRTGWAGVAAELIGSEPWTTLSITRADGDIACRTMQLRVETEGLPAARDGFAAHSRLRRFLDELDATPAGEHGDLRALFDAAFAGPGAPLDAEALGLSCGLTVAEVSALLDAGVAAADVPSDAGSDPALAA